MFKKAVLLSLLATLSGMSAYAGLLDDFREDIVKNRAYALRIGEQMQENYTFIKAPDSFWVPVIAPSESDYNSIFANMRSFFFVPFPEFSDSQDLRKMLPGDMAWQALDNFKIPPQNIRVSFLSQHYFKGEEKGLELFPLFKDIDNISISEPCQYNKKVLVGLFHPTLRNNEVSQKGGWDKFWPVRLSHQSRKIVSPHQMDEFFLSIHIDEENNITLTSPDKITIKELPLSNQGQTVGLWSLTIDKETLQAEVVFHLLVNDADHEILEKVCMRPSSLKIEDLPSYLEKKKFGGVEDNTHLQVLKRLFQK